jgi:hypothetical protein
LTRPINSSMIFGGSPAAGMTVGADMTRAMPNNYTQNQRRSIRLQEPGPESASSLKVRKPISDTRLRLSIKHP